MGEIAIVADQIERRATADLVPYARNARTHSPEQVGQIAGSMREFGWTYPVLVDEDDGIIAGHGRVLAAQKLKLAEVPVIVAKGWSEAKKRAYVLADNQLALNAGWDEGLLRIELQELQGLGFDLSLTGFSSGDLTKLFSTQEGNTDPDDTPEPPTAPVSLAGDLWRLGDHWLICGDSTDPETVAKVLGGAKPHLMVTDQPYGVSYDAGWRNDAVQAGNGARGAPGGRAVGKVSNDDRADWRETWALFPGDVAYVWHGHIQGAACAASLQATDFELRSAIVWNKGSIVISRGHYHWQHEALFYAVRKGATGHWQGSRKESTVWDISRPKKSETGHSTQKPVECMARPIRNNSAPGDHVYEPFSGSGTTIIAAQMNKRICHAVELSPAYVDVAAKRFADFTGVAPILAETGETFEQVRARRLEVV